MTRPFAWMLLTSLMLGVVGCGGGDKPANGPAPVATTGAVDPACELAKPVAPPIEISPFVHHTAGDVALIMARPSRAMKNPIVTGMIKEIEAADPSVNVADELKKIQDELQIDPQQVEYVVVSVSQKTLAAVTPQRHREPDFGPPPVEAPEAPENEAPPKDPGTELPPAEESTTEESKPTPCADEPAAAGQEEPAPPVESTDAPPAGDDAPPITEGADSLTGDMEEGMDPFAPPPSPAVLVRLLAPIDGPAWIAKMEAKDKANTEKMFGHSESSHEGLDKEVVAEMKKQQAEFLQSMLKDSEIHRTEHGGVTLYQRGEAQDRLCLLNPQTVLYAPEAVVKAAIDRKGTAEASPLSAQLQALQDRDFAVAIDLAPVDAMSKSGQLELPFMVQIFAAPLLKCRYLSLAADINGGHLLQVNLVAADEAGAKQLHKMLNPQLTDGIAKARAAKDDPSLPAEASPFLPLGLQILDGTKLTQTGDALSLVVARPASLEDLPTLARPAIAEAAKKKREATARNDLKQIGLAMHNYHETYGNFPANDGGDTPAVGLSWRVHILPFVDAAPLYNEFHMDEPWDSEHTKALISRMPKTYGASAEGKTSIHVFVGEGTPFGGKPFSLREVTDGTSNTILCVRAGEDTADIWTKPGGLSFDKENPIAALGMIGDLFDVLFMDGSARRLPKTIDAATLGNLILHNDGNVVEIPE